jgi:hypothetical protein
VSAPGSTPSIAVLRRTIQRRTSNLYDTWFTRRVSVYVTYVLSRLGIGANPVSAAGLIVGVAACSAMAFGDDPLVRLLGVALVHLYAVLDSVDGELARLHRSFSLRGLFIEDLSAYTMINGFNLAIAISLWRTGQGSWPLVIAVAFVAFGRNAMPAARRAIMKSVATRRPVRESRAPVAASGGARRSIRAFVENHLLHYTNIWVVLSSLLAVDVLAGTRILVYGFVAAMLGQWAREAAVLAQLLRGGLDQQLLAVYRNATEMPGDPAVDGLDLARY